MLPTLLAFTLSQTAPTGMVDVTAAVGLGPDVVPETVARVAFADLNNDNWPDIVVNRSRVFLNAADANSPIGRKFLEVPKEKTGLEEPLPGTTANFADLDNDGNLDAIIAENVQPDNPEWKDHGKRTRWQKGRGDGTFEAAEPLPVPPRPTIATAIGDLDRDGSLDVYFGNSYQTGSYAGFPGDLLLKVHKDLEPERWEHSEVPPGDIEFDEKKDAGARPTYGAMFVNLDEETPQILSLSYGRRGNRLWNRITRDKWLDNAPLMGLDGDDVRHGEYPQWLYERAKTDTRFPTKAELPFRANGNTFDAAISDVDNDGRFDLFLSEITHAWAGESSDRSRMLFQIGLGRFTTKPGFSVDRIEGYDPMRWNQGDLFAELADMNSDGLVDLILSSGDYPDQHLRIYLQEKDKGFVEAKNAFAEKHDGSQQVSLGDIDGDGALDLVVGQTFNRLNAEQIGGRKPHLKIFVNRMAPENKSLLIRLKGDGEKINRNALGAIVKVILPNGKQLMRQLVGIGGHAGKQHDFVVHFGLGEVEEVRQVSVIWPSRTWEAGKAMSVKAGSYTLEFGRM